MKIIVLFKTHLDVGFTDYSEQVVNKYINHYIPQAISVAEQVDAQGRKEGFVWTLGSWLIDHYLRVTDGEKRARLENAIEKGWISWHALPCTFHSEVCSEELFKYGLSISKKLDERFGKTTIGAKYTDVPGHTAAIIPHLKNSGVSFLHIGVNPASMPVQVPSAFCWRFENQDITVMYNGGDYGEFTRIPNTDTYVYFAHTGDNLGPQTAEEIFKVYDEIYEKYPEASVTAGNLNDVALELEQVKSQLPVVEKELGDTWIHGSATDPQKISQYRALLRYAKTLDTQQAEKIYDKLLLVPEHTWGMDEKKHLKENKNYIRPLFEKARNNYNYKKMELSWAEQRRYVLDAAAQIEDKEKAAELLSEYYVKRVDFSKLQPIEESETTLNGMSLKLSQNGEIVKFSYKSAGIELNNCSLFHFSYDEYSYDEVWAFDKAYLDKKYVEPFETLGKSNWAIEDFCKVGLQLERNKHTNAIPNGYKLYTDGQSLFIWYSLDATVTAENGQPQECVLKITPESEKVLFDFSWFNKPANRAPEALWLSFNPNMTLKGITKIGRVINPSNVIEKGGRGLHATDGTVLFDGVKLELIDSVLISVGGKNIYNFLTDEPNVNNGIYINLFNNQWGTNFPMWNEGDGRTRFILSAK